MKRVLCPSGLLVLFEHNTWHPVTRFVVSRCKFDDNAILLSRSHACSLLRTARLQRIESSYIIFLPWGIGVNEVLETIFGWMPFGAQSYAAGVK